MPTFKHTAKPIQRNVYFVLGEGVPDSKRTALNRSQGQSLRSDLT
jgi:hypothetical protein